MKTETLGIVYFPILHSQILCEYLLLTEREATIRGWPDTIKLLLNCWFSSYLQLSIQSRLWQEKHSCKSIQ